MAGNWCGERITKPIESVEGKFFDISHYYVDLAFQSDKHKRWMDGPPGWMWSGNYYFPITIA